MPIPEPHIPSTELHHASLKTTFVGIEHPVSTTDTRVLQFRGIKYASIPARFRQSKLFTSYHPVTDASKYGPICPQVKFTKTIEEELFGVVEEDIPKQSLKQNEFECLNLNITCPAGLTTLSRVPVMLWVHGGGDRGSGSSWVYDGGKLVRKSMLSDKPVILVTFNFRLGLFGFGVGPMIREDNKAAGEEGAGNYGLRDQRKALEWVFHFIAGFGGDPYNITLFGESTGAFDIVSHLLSRENELRPLFQRAIIQSPIIDPSLPDVAGAGWHLSRMMAAMRVTTIEQLRALESDELVGLGGNLRAVDDEVFFRAGWKEMLMPEDAHHRHHIDERVTSPAFSHSLPHILSQKHILHPTRHTTPILKLPANLQPLIIGDCSSDALLWHLPASLWTPTGVVRRLRAVCQSLAKASNLLRAYDISSYTPDDEIVERVLELVNDARVAWPTECIAQGAKRERGGRGVWRYVFDQEGPARGIPHHAADLIYLFDNVPLPSFCQPSTSSSTSSLDGASTKSCDGFDSFEGYSSDEDEGDLKFKSVVIRGESDDEDDEWGTSTVDAWAYSRVRDTLQERWIAFAHGEAPWNEDKVFVFGPEGETGERSSCIFEGRRRRGTWKEALEPLGMQLVQKVGMELSRGPSNGGKAKY